MPIVTVQFNRLIQDSQDYGSTEEHMVSRLFFSVSLDGQHQSDATVNVKQIVGTSFKDADLEVSKPVGYDGPWDHDAFSKIAQEYYRQLIGGPNSFIQVSGSGSVRMRDGIVVNSVTRQFEVTRPNGSAW